MGERPPSSPVAPVRGISVPTDTSPSPRAKFPLGEAAAGDVVHNIRGLLLYRDYFVGFAMPARVRNCSIT